MEVAALPEGTEDALSLQLQGKDELEALARGLRCFIGFLFGFFFRILVEGEETLLRRLEGGPALLGGILNSRLDLMGPPAKKASPLADIIALLFPDIHTFQSAFRGQKEETADALPLFKSLSRKGRSGTHFANGPIHAAIGMKTFRQMATLDATARSPKVQKSTMDTLHIRNLPPCPGRTFILGDVHGCAVELRRMLELLEPETADRILAVGDLVNRGPDSAGVLDIARKHNIQPVLGNHEDRLLRAWKSGDASNLKERDRATFDQLSGDDFAWMAQCPHVFRLLELRALVVHGGFLPGKALEKQPPAEVLRLQVLDEEGRPRKRNECPDGRPWAERWQGPELVLYGHTPRPDPLVHPHAVGLDTGCVYGYQLTALRLPDRTVFKVPAIRAYAE